MSRLVRLKLLVILITVSCAVAVYSQDGDGNGITDRLDLPGTQRNPALPAVGADFDIDEAINPATDCQSCHSTDTKAGPFPPWGGSMMANSARDPVFWAQLDVAEADEASDPNLVGARDLCLRCHAPKGWLEGRSSGPTLPTALRGMELQENDLFGVQCAACHRLVDRDAAAVDAIDTNMLTGLNTHPNPELQVPPSYGNGMYVMDRFDVRRGPFSSAHIGWANLVPQFINVPADWPPPPADTHPLKQSAFHRSGNLCGTCHDVSNPAWTPAAPKGDAQQNFPIERTWTEWRHSAYPARGENGNCQSCHMSGVLNGVVAGGASGNVVNPNQHLNDVHVHDFTGGNVWIPRVIAEMVARYQTTKNAPDPGLSPVIGATQADRDAFLSANYARAMKAIYPPGAFGRPGGAQPPPLGFNAANYTDASDRAKATLRRAAQLSATRLPASDLKVRVWNMTGHKLPTGYPEGRRMWLDVRFANVNPADASEPLDAQSGEYNAAAAELYHDFNMDNAAGPRTYDVAGYTNGSGGPVAGGRRTQVYEARMHHTPSGAEFHFIKNNERVNDNRIPPLGWVKAQYLANKAEQVTPAPYAATQTIYHDDVTGPAAMPPVIEDTYNFDEVAYPVPAASDVAEIRLQYQSVSKEYIEELVAASPRTLLYPVSGVAGAFSRADVLEHAWRNFSLDGTTRFPPVEMTRLRVALVDSDGDGLSDDWETAHGLNPADATGDNGRNGDPDGDGRSNYLEFQEKTPANSPDALRGPVDLVLVLDYSGSMNEPAPVSGTPKIDVLKDAADLFLKTWKQYAVRADRIGVVYFSGGVAVEGGALVDFSTLPPATTIETKIDELIAAVRARPAGGATAMGGGIQRALNLLQGAAPGRRKQMTVFTNGMQNYSPMVRADMGGHYRVAPEPVSFAAGVYGDSGVTDAGGPAFGTLLNTLGVQIHTIGIGVAETADDRWLNLIRGIAADTSLPMEENQSVFISRAFELEGAFLNNLVAGLRGFSPQMLSEQRKRLEAGQESQTLDFVLDEAATKATFILSWAGAQTPEPLEFELLAPDGSAALALARVTDRASYRIATCYLPLSRPDGRPVGHAGQWKMVVRRAGQQQPGRPVTVGPAPKRDGATDYRAYLIADIPEMQYDVSFAKRVYRAGEDVTLHVELRDGSQPVRTLQKITAEIARASVNFGDLISRQRVDAGALERAMAVADDAPPDRADAKSRLALLDENFAGRVRPARNEIELYDDGRPEHGDSLPGDGVFSASLGRARVPGLIAADVTLSGQTARSPDFSRHYHASTLVRHAKFDGGSSKVSASRLGARNGNWVVQIKVKPIDANGHYLGPGYRDRLTIDVPGFAADSPIQDALDGSYTRNFLIPSSSLGALVKVVFEQESIYNGTVRRALVLGWLWLILLMLLLLLILLAVWAWLWWKKHHAAAASTP